MDNIPAYIRRKHGQEPVTYLHPLLEPYLKKTYGIFVYQEDIMASAIALGGFTGPEADTLGYAIRKKKSSVLRSMKDQFVSQAAERGVPAATIDAVFTAFQPFERYGFNKAHATCYGLVAYQTAYLKANYTVEYMTSVLTASRDSAEKIAAAIAECRRMGIEVLPPDIRSSSVEFSVEGDAIRFGLIAVRNVGQGAIESIIAARAGGEFRSLTDFCERIDLRLANKRVLESLARVGGLVAFGHPAQILAGLDDAVNAASATQRDRISGQVSLFDLAAGDATLLDAPLPQVTEAPTRERLRWEKELLGLYLSDHPLKEIAEAVGPFVTAYSGDLPGRIPGPAARGRVRNRHRHPDRDHQGQGDDGDRDDRGSAGLGRGRRLPAPLRDHPADLARGPDPARLRPGRPQGRGGLAARRPRHGLGRGADPRRQRPSPPRSPPSTEAAIGARAAAPNRAAGRRDSGGRPERPAMATPVAGQPIAVGPGHPAAIPPGVAVSPLRGGSSAGVVHGGTGRSPRRRGATVDRSW